MKPPDIHILHTSDFYQLRNFKCNCHECHTSKVEYVNAFSLCFVRSGYFEFEVFRGILEVHVGRVLVSKPGSEHIARHIDEQPDICSVLDFKKDFYDSLREHYGYEWFFGNNDIHSLLLKCSAELDYLHYNMLTNAGKAASLQIDDLVLRIVDRVMRSLGNLPTIESVPSRLKKFHLSTIEKAKNYLLANFDKNISLQQLADHCCVSLFHFSRIFRELMKTTPHQYLTEIRLNHAELLLKNTRFPVTQVAIQCGYNSVEHFATAYKHRFNTKPSESRTI